MGKNSAAVGWALLAAALYAVNVPLSKLLLGSVGPTMLAGLLYVGAGVGMGAMLLGQGLAGRLEEQQWLERRDLPYTAAMVVLDIAAPILLMFGVRETSPANVSLLNNFEIAATSLIALAIFREKLSGLLWTAIVLAVAGSAVLSWAGGGLGLDRGALLVLGACLCWGLENNCTRSISHKSARQIVLIKGLGSGTGGVIMALVLGEQFPAWGPLVLALVLGFVAYGLSIYFYIRAQKDLGAARTSAFYALAPFLGVGFSFLLLGESPAPRFYLALGLMVLSTLLTVRDALGPGLTHTHAHRHGSLVHTHAHRHLALGPLHMHIHK